MRTKYLVHVLEDGFDLFVIKGDGALYENETLVCNTVADAESRIIDMQGKFPEAKYTIIPVELPDA
jgi:hypothetical protein